MTHSYKSRLHKPSKTAIALVIFLPLAAIGLFHLPASGTGQELDSQLFDAEMLLDPIALLQKRIDRGEVELDFTFQRGFLDSLMEVLDIPVSSQTFVFSKTSFQAPRALYFNDDVYLGWVNGGPVIEIAAVAPSAEQFPAHWSRTRMASRHSSRRARAASSVTGLRVPTSRCRSWS
jgi:hypothetical protein